MEDSIFNVEQLVVAVKLAPAQNEVALEQATSGASSADRDEILARARRVKLFNGRFESSNFFSFRLPSGYTAIGRLIPQRGKPLSAGEFYFQCLIASPEVFYNGGADPIRLALHAMNTTFFSAYQPGVALKSFRLDEAISHANLGEVRRTSGKIGVHTLAVLLQALFQYDQTYFVTDYHAFLLVSNVFTLLPVFARRELSFSVGLFFQDDETSNFVGVTLPKRVPFRCRETLDAESFLDLRDVAENGSEYPVDLPWAKLVEDVLQRDLGDSFFYKIARNYLDEEPPLETGDDLRTRLEEVEALGEEWQEFFASDSPDKLEGFERGTDGFDENDLEDRFGTFDGYSDDANDSEGEEWKQGSLFDANDYEERVDEDEEKEDESLHKVRFFEIPRKCEDGAQDSIPERLEQGELFESPLNVPRPREVAQFLEARLSRRALDEDETKRADGGLRFPPFVILSAEYPEKNVVLRTLDALVFSALSGNAAAKRDVARVWKEFCATSEKETSNRARELYFLDLLAAVKNDDGIANEAREEQLSNILELARVLATE